MAYPDIERRILDMWPKFEDGSYVWFGDKAVANSGRNEGKEFTVGQVYFENEHDKLLGSVPDGCYWNYKAADPYVKRPAPKVLDADGVEIKAGDRVYSIENGNSYIVRSINGSGTLELEGFEYKGWSPKFFTHMQPAIDADGALIKVGDTVWVDEGTDRCKVIEVDGGTVHVQYADGFIFEHNPSRLSHKYPDSWERLEEDAAKGVCEYAGAEREPGTINVYTCCGCRFDEDSDGPTCDKQMAHDIIRRAKALAEKEAGR